MRIRKHANLLSGILFTLILGTLLHFFYTWSGENAFVALFSPVNESVWEHLKLLFFPTLLYTLFEIIALSKTSPGFLASRVAGLLTGMFLIVSLYFTYTGITGLESLTMDILIFILGILATFLLSRLLETRCPDFHFLLSGSYCLLILLALTFFSFTIYPPRLPVFWPPVHSASSMILLLPK